MRGCGTTIDAAEKLGREWIGIDVTQLAISLIKNRRQDTYGRRIKFISGSSRREEAQTEEPGIGDRESEIDQSLVTAAATAAEGFLVRIIGEATTPNDAASAGFYERKTNKQKFPCLQLRTVKELMEGKGIERPTCAAAIEETFKKAPESKKKKHGHQTELTI